MLASGWAATSGPHGVVPREAVKAHYQGQQVVIDPLPDYLYEVAIKH